MAVSLPTLRIGEPLRHESLVVFPLFSDANSSEANETANVNLVDYQLSNVAIADETLLVEEVDEGGSVPELLVENKSNRRVLFLEGEELVGAKQNRILNTSVLVAPLSKLKIPVSCVEQGRWGYKSRYFGSSGSHSPAKLRRTLKKHVNKSVSESRSHRSNQGEVWREVAELNAAHGVQSGTGAMEAAFDTHQERIEEYRKELSYVEGSIGLAVAIADKVVSIDLFDKPTTCQIVWNRLLSGVAFDAMEAEQKTEGKDTASSPTQEDVEQLIAATGNYPWEQAPAVGEGEEFRAEATSGDQASVLSFEDVLVHGSVMTAE